MAHLLSPENEHELCFIWGRLESHKIRGPNRSEKMIDISFNDFQNVLHKTKRYVLHCSRRASTRSS